MKNINRIYPQLLAVLGFVIVALIYFYPVLQGKVLYQSDIAQYTGMAKEQNDFRKANDQEPYWTNSAFGGMPTYQMGANYPHNYIKALDGVLRFLPRPADYLFLYFLGFFVLLRILKVDTLKAFFGALAFGLSTYLIVILGAGHNAKAHTIAYMPLVVGGIILVFRKRYVIGGLLTLLATALEINANHFQMTYYLLFLLFFVGLYYVIHFAKKKDYRHLGISAGVFAVAGIVALGLNATSLMATAEYTPYSIRGKSELTFKPNNKPVTSNSAMDYDYITQYSYGKAESFNLIVPRLFGGGSVEAGKKDGKVYSFFMNLGASPSEAANYSENIPTYWGDQPIVEAPAYIGIVVFFLAVFALFADKRKIKYAFLAGAIITLLLSWGKNFHALTNFFINYVPLYDKFRAVSSIQVILELCAPLLAFMGLQTFFKIEDKKQQFAYLWQSAGVVVVILLGLYVLKGSFSFEGLRDVEYARSVFGEQGFAQAGAGFLNALKQERMDMYTADIFRSLLYVLAAGAALFLFTKQKLNETVTVIVIGLLIVTDLFTFDRNYVNAKEKTEINPRGDFVSARKMDEPFEMTPADAEIMTDTTHYRVYDPFARQQARTSYFHQTVGGYSAVRPRREDELFTYSFEKGGNDDFDPIFKNIDEQTLSLKAPVPLLDLMNIKYILLQNNEGYVTVKNPNAAGAAWFVSSVKPVATPDEELKATLKLDAKNVAVINKDKFPEAVQETTFVKDSTAVIKLDSYEPNNLEYTSQNKNEGLAVFSEMYYGKGWNVYIDGKLTPHYQADYVLRALPVPAGKHKIIFKFEPQVVKTGSTISLISFVIFLALLGAGVWYERKKAHQPPKVESGPEKNKP